MVVDTYRSTRSFPLEERFGLRAQIRRAAVSVPTNIVEGRSRPWGRDYVRFLDIALASASEARYLLGLTNRLGLLSATESVPLVRRYGDLVRALQSMVTALRIDAESGPA